MSNYKGYYIKNKNIYYIRDGALWAGVIYPCGFLAVQCVLGWTGLTLCHIVGRGGRILLNDKGTDYMNIATIMIPEGVNLDANTLWSLYQDQLAQGHVYRKDENDIHDFVEQMCTLQEGLTVSKSELYIIFSLWTDVHPRPTLVRFNKAIKKYGVYDVRPSINGERVRCWRGIGLKP